MRHIFVEKVQEYLRLNNNSYFLTADLGFKAFESLQAEFPDRFINTGVGENNTLGVASGMAMSGKKVFVYSIVPFLIFRNFEIIRNYISHNKLDVKLIGAGGGFSYGNQGISHNTFEDFAIMRTLPNFRIFSPGTRDEVSKCCNKIFNNPDPSYIRLGKAPLENYKAIESVQDVGEFYKKGNDLLIISTGNLIDEVIKSANKLHLKSIDCSVFSFYNIKPIKEELIIRILEKYSKIIVVEENVIIGGLNSIISEIKVKNELGCSIYPLALEDKVHNIIGDQDYLRKINKIDNKSITDFIIKIINK